MSHRATAFAVVAAALLVTVTVTGPGGAGVAAGAPTAGPTDARPTALAVSDRPVADLTDTIQRIDEFLEAVLDLVRTLNRLFGEGGD